MTDSAESVLKEKLEGLEGEDRLSAIEEIRQLLHELSPEKEMPIDLVLWVPLERVRANDYNPNSVAQREMQLLYTSIAHDGYTQPVVTVYNDQDDVYEIVDGFHRYSTMKANQDIQEKTGGKLPIVVINTDINDRMASTVRHNRARGKHAVSGMSSMVFSMLDNGWKDEDICRELGMSADELLRLKHVTGFSKLFENVEYRRAWETRKQIKLRQQYKEGTSIWAKEEKKQAARKNGKASHIPEASIKELEDSISEAGEETPPELLGDDQPDA